MNHMCVMVLLMKAKKVEMGRLTFNIEKSVKTRIQQLALDKETTITDLCVEWIIDGLEKETGQQQLDVE